MPADPLRAQRASEPPSRSGVVQSSSHAHVAAFGLSHRGCIRSRNEDAYLVARHLGLFAVSDGMGGAAAGEVASRMAVEELGAAFEETDIASAAAPPPFATVVARANAHIYATAQADSTRHGMGATLTALHLVPGGAALIHVGDSRAYRLRRGQLQQLTQDHSLVAEQVRAGKMTEEEARRSPFRHIISRALGTHSEVLADEHPVGIEPGDTLLLCTDGLHGVVEDETLGEILRRTTELPRTAVDLIQASLDAGGPDNVAVVLVHFDQDFSRSSAGALELGHD
jgi:protein phosphatase